MERIALSNSAFEGDNNVYLFAGGEETVLVDTGDWMDATREQLQAGLADYGVTFADIDRILLTHWHHDHTGLAGEIQAAGGATVHIHEADAALVAGDEAAWADLTAAQERYFDQWAIPEPRQAILRDIFTSHEDVEPRPDVTRFEDGATFTVGDIELRAVHTSGHAAGLCLYEIHGDGPVSVLSGDALLPVYTPNVGGADVRVEQPLEKYLRALSTIVEADYERAWPGHRDPIDDPADRAATIIHHHKQRAYRVLDALRRRGPSDIWRISADLFGELEEIHNLHGPGECYAHLEHLERAGEVVSEGNEYRLAEGVAERVRERDDGIWPLEY
jgi:glyoxylase-like metal-dependent hydrolase (beta-lactamase superfamily II)